MNKETITEMLKRFNSISKVTADGVEYWQARELMVVLGYNNWRSFENVISKAIIACETTGYDVENYFISTYKEALLGKSGIRNVSDYMLTRYACYLIAQNGDSKKDEIAFAQSYFALQTRKQELIEDRLSLNKRMETRDRLKESEKKLSQNIYERGVDEKGFGRIRSHGDMALFGGYSTQEMKQRLNIKGNRPLADFLPTLSIAAKNLAAEMTNYNVEEKDLRGESSITDEHVQNNKSVRKMLGERGIKPENLPPEEDIKKLQKNIKTQMKNMRYQFFGNLIRGKISVSKLMEQGNELGIDLMAPAYNFMLFKIFSKNENDTEAVYDLRTKEDAIVEEVSSQFENMIVFHRVTEGYILMIKAQNKEETIQVAKDYVAALTKRMKKEKELQWFAGIGRAAERLHNLSESYDSASKAFAYQYQSSGNEAVFFDKLDNEKIERAEDLQQVDFTKVNSESLEEFLNNGKEEAVHLPRH